MLLIRLNPSSFVGNLQIFITEGDKRSTDNKQRQSTAGRIVIKLYTQLYSYTSQGRYSGQNKS